MYEVMGLINYGTWLRKGVKCLCPDTLATELSKKGHLKVLKYHVTRIGKWRVKSSLRELKEQRRVIDLKIEGYENYLKSVK